MADIKDKRLGWVLPDGKLKWPTQYPDGSPFFYKARPDVTRMQIGDQGHFVVLPINRFQVIPETMDELREAIGLEPLNQKSASSSRPNPTPFVVPDHTPDPVIDTTAHPKHSDAATDDDPADESSKNAKKK